MRAALSALLAVSFTFAVSSARSDEKAEAKRHFDAAVVLLKAEDFAAAAAEFEASVSLHPTKNGLFNLANCYKALHKYPEALAALDSLEREYGKSLTGELKSSAETMRKELESVICTIKVRVKKPGASVFVDGELVGKSPLPISATVGPGDHEVRVKLPGAAPVVQSVKLVSGDTRVLEIAMDGTDAAVGSPAVAAPAGPSPAHPQATVGGAAPSLGENQAMLSVMLDSKKVTEADVYVDGQLVGQAPWQGIVVPGQHTVRVVPKNAYGPKEEETKVWPQRTRVLEFGGFVSNDQRTWTEWFGMRLYGGFSSHQWFYNMADQYSEKDEDYYCDETTNEHLSEPDKTLCSKRVGRPILGRYLVDDPTGLLGGEMSFFTVRWNHFFWELLNGGGNYPMMMYWGSAIGVPFHSGKNEARLGAHLTMTLGVNPSASGLQLHWVRHIARHFAFELGLKQFSFPFAMGVTIGFRI